jgi:Protein of unknown function
MRPIIRNLLIAGGVLIGLLVVAWIGLHLYLSSAAVRRTAGERLGKMVGAAVEVDALQVGLHSSTARLRIFEPPDGGGNRQELLSVQAAETDLSLFDLATDHLMPRSMTLRGVHLTLRFDRQGKLLTQLPKFESLSSSPAPTIQLDSGGVTIQQEGRPDFNLSGVQGRLTPDGQRFTLTGTVNDAVWGAWTLQGDGDLGQRTGEAQAEADAFQIKGGYLNSLPLIPAEVWQHLEPEGPAAARLQLTLGRDDKIGVEGTITLKGIQVKMPDIESEIDNATGALVLKDGVITVRNGKGRLAGGEVQMNATLHFQDRDPHLEAHLRCQGVDIRKLPASWSLPKQIEGQLKGKADLEVIYHTGSLETRGGGRADVENAKIAGLPAQVELELHSDGKRFRFASTNP